MYELTIMTEFEAAHTIENYKGKCSRLHGHNWKVEVAVEGKKLDDLGMVIDFREFKTKVNKVIEEFDHYYLNDLPSFQNTTPSAENISKYIFDTLQNKFSDEIVLKYIKVWESPRSAVKYYLED
ncbi:6-carboxytetrahydropterin synthase QueD [Selenomonadales bacterium OttesenSCG-928-I06]|nr:6-carboxytetrahydropterin synthase QueD [Selenomonadales bacterium OttesenSCG-928-I06]